jgi:hypothetical protein
MLATILKIIASRPPLLFYPISVSLAKSDTPLLARSLHPPSPVLVVVRSCSIPICATCYYLFPETSTPRARCSNRSCLIPIVHDERLLVFVRRGAISPHYLFCASGEILAMCSWPISVFGLNRSCPIPIVFTTFCWPFSIESLYCTVLLLLLLQRNTRAWHPARSQQNQQKY